jgi:hypothetical protein
MIVGFVSGLAFVAGRYRIGQDDPSLIFRQSGSCPDLVLESILRNNFGQNLPIKPNLANLKFVCNYDPIWGRCYDHNFLRFLTIFAEKIGVFLKNQCYDQNFA